MAQVIESGGRIPYTGKITAEALKEFIGEDLASEAVPGIGRLLIFKKPARRSGGFADINLTASAMLGVAVYGVAVELEPIEYETMHAQAR